MKKTILLFLSLVCLNLTNSYSQTKNTFQLDAGHTHIGFDVERFMVGEVSGRFNEFVANIDMNDEDFTTLKLSATIEVASIDSNNKVRDGHLKAPIWLDEKNHPEIKFVSTSVVKKGDNYIMKGNFTIKGTTKQVEFPVVFKGPFTDPTGSNTIGIQADFVINRFDYGINLSKKLKDGSYFIGEDVKIKIRALAIKK